MHATRERDINAIQFHRICKSHQSHPPNANQSSHDLIGNKSHDPHAKQSHHFIANQSQHPVAKQSIHCQPIASFHCQPITASHCQPTNYIIPYFRRIQLSMHSFFSTYLLLLILWIIPSFSLFFEIGLVLMVFLLIGSHLIYHLALKQSHSMIPSLHSLLFHMVYPKIPFLAHCFSLYILLILVRWSPKISQLSFVRWWYPAEQWTSLSLLQILLYFLKHHHFHWHSL